MKTGVLAVLAAAGVAAGLVAAPRARAGQYEVHGCRLPAGGPVPAVGWLGAFGPGPWLSSDNLCARVGGFLQAGLTRVAGYEHPQGTRSSWRFAAPPGTRLRRVRGDVAMRTAPGQPFGSPVAWGVSDDGQGRFGIQYAAARGSLWEPWHPANAFDTGVMGATAGYTFAAECSGGFNPCPDPGPSEPGVALLRLFRAQVTLEDLSPPSLGAPARGRLAEAGVHRGSEGVTVEAADEGSGVHRLVLELDGREAGARVLDDSAGQCADRLPASPARDFTVPVPCPPSVSGGVLVDTRGLPEGDHVLRLLVEDAAGNTRVAAGPVWPWIVDNVVAADGSGGVPAAPAPPGGPGAPGPAPPARAAARISLWFVVPSRRRVCRAGRCRRLPARFTERRGSSLTQRYGRRLLLSGRVELADGRPVAGATLTLRRLVHGARRPSERSVARSDRHGRFSVRLGRSSSERISVLWRPAGGWPAVSSRTLTRRVRAGVGLLPYGGAGPLRGVLHGGRRPWLGVPVVAELRTRAGWLVFAGTRVTPGMRGFTLPAPRGPGVSVVRLRSLAAPGWPYGQGTSRAARIRSR